VLPRISLEYLQRLAKREAIRKVGWGWSKGVFGFVRRLTFEMPRTPARFGSFSICRRHECLGWTAASEFDDRMSRQRWLQTFKGNPFWIATLRRIAEEEVPGSNPSRLNDDEVIAQIAHLIDNRRLCIRREEDSGDGLARWKGFGSPGQSAEDRVIQALRSKDQSFAFEGQKLRIIRVKQWPAFRTDQRYEIIESDNARQILSRISTLPTVSGNEKAMLRRASELISVGTSGPSEDGLLLLRITPLRYSSASSSEPPISPSQLAKALKPEIIEEVNPLITGTPNELDTSDDGFVAESEPDAELEAQDKEGDEVGQESADAKAEDAGSTAKS
jgi:hypothetical protein